MSNPASNFSPKDIHNININEEYEARYWIHKFNCTKEELHEAVKAVGSSSTKVQEYIIRK